MNIRRARTAVKNAAAVVLGPALSMDTFRLGPRVLCYHGIKGSPGAHWGLDFFDISPSTFAAQLAYLEARGVRFSSLSAVDSQPRPTPWTTAVAVTFDDGERSFLRAALPVLERRSVPVTLFVTTGMIGTSSDWLGWDDIKYLDSCSNISIEAHTVTHPYLNRLSDQTLRDELAFSKDTLESLLGHAILRMAYPYGAYDSRVLSMARGVGYCAAYTTKCGPVQASAYSLETPRALVNSADSLSTLCRKLRGCYDWI